MGPSRHIRDFQQTVYDYYKKHKRNLPWRQTGDPYKILVSEIMLQQTQVPRVLEKYPQFLNAFPDVTTLAGAPLREIMNVWQGMGYNRRALALQNVAVAIVTRHGGIIPSDIEALKRLPGIGYTTACAICAFAFNKPVVFIETNIRSVFIQHFFNGRKRVGDAELFPLVEQALDMKNPRTWYSALMDYGTILKKRYANPSRNSAHHYRQTPFKGSDRQLRGLILKRLVAQSKIRETSLCKKSAFDSARMKRIIGKMCDEGLMKKRGAYLSL
jgi:A/G-specific adenine glycosylase